mmetsp:Transcript_81986/g.171607  ORF Transcript_81986/g.171607 Transcript_81986/m.171607 type:complete len:372 (+) Transcript_81986:62-1177(+)|eukprot:CAMPEP_0206620966 /NCGR_PEP_ID=MMETSP0325_2-20121206/61959_1 /ASSEMBLY_ACC=CAM_ASM_000347 /TAXON_ID=2866 /ORGANISM="Crypthecodinium cohnii, Strain Seligo" /LENGTH=371 /DNA_ID=CAMNT_0054144069 /DNA_START=36 /DNA_END=1151 /DNA_ORIENTATION=-
MDKSVLLQSAGSKMTKVQSLEVQVDELSQKVTTLAREIGRQHEPAPRICFPDDVKAEMERFRKLFEFIESVLPKDAAEAMKFFNSKHSMDACVKTDNPLGLGVELEQHTRRLEEGMRKHREELDRELNNLRVAIKALQRDAESGSSRVSDLAIKLRGLEINSSTTNVTEQGSGPLPEQLGQTLPQGQAISYESEKTLFTQTFGDLGQGLAMPEVQECIDQSVETLRDEVRHWLDAFHQGLQQSLQEKAGVNDLRGVADLLMKSSAAEKPSGGELALLAHRPLLGRCSSCGTYISTEAAAAARRGVQVSGSQGAWPAKAPSGAQSAIRPIFERRNDGRLPNITERNYQSFSKSKALRNNSQPELRSVAPIDA